jgi:uncharacterized membrane protein/predicted DsbA family dithiol-disulfide isomerase
MRNVALLLALAGLAASISASYVHYRLLSDPLYASACDISATISCTQAYSSRYGSLAGFPVAPLGALWFGMATLLAVAGLIGSPAVRENVPGYLFAISTPGLAMVLYLAYASFFVLQVWCIFCVITYVAVVGLFLLSGAATSVPIWSLPARALRDVGLLVRSPAAVALSLVFVVATAGTFAYFPREGAPAAPLAAQNVDENQARPPAGAQQTELERMMSTAPRVPLDVPAEGAEVVVVKFNDYQCPACAQSYLLYKSVLAKYQSSSPGAVRVVLKDFPLEPECNAGVRTVLHESACEAAVAVRLAREHNRGEAMEDWLYSNQGSMTPDSVRRAAREVGSVTDFDARYAGTLELVKADAAVGVQLGIRSTPTFFINGVKVEGAWQPQYFDQAIAFELQRAP